jgi:hypothetical protein
VQEKQQQRQKKYKVYVQTPGPPTATPLFTFTRVVMCIAAIITRFWRLVLTQSHTLSLATHALNHSLPPSLSIYSHSLSAKPARRLGIERWAELVDPNYYNGIVILFKSSHV